MTTAELYDALVSKPDLHSFPELSDNLLIWPLYKGACLYASCDNNEGYIDIVSNSIFQGSLIHWHPHEDHILDELYALGKKGHILVLKKRLFGTSTFYMGPAKEYPLLDKKAWDVGKKKWDSGQLIYLEQK